MKTFQFGNYENILTVRILIYLSDKPREEYNLQGRNGRPSRERWTEAVTSSSSSSVSPRSPDRPPTTGGSRQVKDWNGIMEGQEK